MSAHRRPIRPRSTLTSVSQVLADLLRGLNLPQDTARKGAVLSSWDRVAGDAASHSRALRFRGTTLLVEADSAAWMNELSLRQGELMRRIEEVAGPGLVTDLRFEIRKRRRGDGG